MPVYAFVYNKLYVDIFWIYSVAIFFPSQGHMIYIFLWKKKVNEYSCSVIMMTRGSLTLARNSELLLARCLLCKERKIKERDRVEKEVKVPASHHCTKHISVIPLFHAGSLRDYGINPVLASPFSATTN